jgi:DNA modification methylase
LEGGVYRKSSDGFVFRNAFHPEIAELCIDEFTRPGDLVVSPFSGSGTILAVAELMGRSWVGYEINARLKGLINESIYGPNRPAIYKNIEKRYLIGNTRSVEKEAGN